MREMNTKTQLDDAALRYHSEGRPGKIGIVPTKPYHTQYDLSLAYSPGVAAPSLAIAEEPDDVYKYTGKGNLVAVISNGTAVLGLGNIGPLAAKPVMEGKSMLFKTYAGIDAFDIEVDTTDPEEFIRTVKAIAPTFGGINLEDIKAPECFVIEERLKEELSIPPAWAPMSPSPRTAVPLEMTATRFPLSVYLYALSGFFSISRHGSATPGE